MQYPQTRYLDSLSVGINSSALSLAVASIPPTRTQGILTLGRQQSNTEDVYYTAVGGNTVTISLRGLSTTALTLTSVAGNQKTHNANESVEITTHHNYDTNKVRLDENETISGIKTFSGNGNSFTGTGNGFTNPLKVGGILDTNGNEVIDTPATASAVNELKVINSATGTAVEITTAGGDANPNLLVSAKGAGIVILEDAAEMASAAAPTTNAGIVNKKYVDDAFIAVALTPLVKVAGEDLTSGNALYIKSSDGKAYKTDATSFGEASENFVGFATSTVSTGGSETIAIGPLVAGLLSGLTAGSNYYLTNTPGAISTTPGSQIKQIGLALSSTQLKLFEAPIASSTNISGGVETRAGNTASGTQSFAHGLGKTPDEIDIKTFYCAQTFSISHSDGTAIRGANLGIFGWLDSVGPSSDVGTSTTKGITCQDPGVGRQEAVVSADATNITLTWTRTGATSGASIVILWKARSF